MKKLTKIRLINWHYFTDETIDVKGSILFSGENASGKSTIIDAIQLVLTTNTRRFNPAANEKSKRTLQGYVRCKTGEEEKTYLRASGPVISYVALEFYEENFKRYFVIGVKIDSHSIDDEPTKKWFCVDGDINSLTFVVAGKPALDKEFTQNGRKVQFEPQVGRAKETFRIRLGRLDETFGDMILKSIAFKPMDKVKDFINTYILPQRDIDTCKLQDNIRSLREMQKLVDEVKSQIKQLTGILNKANKINDYKYEMLVVEILITISLLENEKQKQNELLEKKEKSETIIEGLQKNISDLDEKINNSQLRLDKLNATLLTSEFSTLIIGLQKDIGRVNKDIESTQKSLDEYNKQMEKLKNLDRNTDMNISAEIKTLQSSTIGIEECVENYQKIKSCINRKKEECYSTISHCDNELKIVNGKINSLLNRIESLKKNQLVYDKNTTDLQRYINEEFEKRGIDSRADIFSELLEINPELSEWQDAVEGYLNTQRFNIIVEPQYYDIAVKVYDKNKSKIHTAGLVNIKKINEESHIEEEDSLYSVVKSNNRFARAYAAYLLGRVIRCDSISKLKDYPIAITQQCMKYQGYVLQKIRDDIYKTPYIGKQAPHIQLDMAKKELDELNNEKRILEEQKKRNNYEKELLIDCNIDIIEKNLGTFKNLEKLKKEKQKLDMDLAEIKNNPSFIELSIQLQEAEEEKTALINEKKGLENKIRSQDSEIGGYKTSLEACEKNIKEYSQKKEEKCKNNPKAEQDAEKKYDDNIKKTKSPLTISANYRPRLQTLNNQMESEKEKLVELQTRYKDGEFGTGLEVINYYQDDYNKLEKSDLISYEDKLADIKRDCELEFRESFLAKMRENIEQAKIIIRRLNKSLQGIYYGNDSYVFELSANRESQSIYNMITSDINIGGMSLFTTAFEEQYHNEMEELFAKLTDENLNETKVTRDLTDYRSYLDYDIQVISREGRIQKFSKTYGEKSGGETQTPYYVAIAASFAQMYSDRETIRIILFDEAFNNMDEERIETMMKFLKSQNFQIVLAVPPSRMEIIGEYVDSIYLTIRKDNYSMIEEYYL